MSDKQQSVIDWLEKEYNLKCKLTPVDFYQAKEMHKQEVIEAFIDGLTPSKENLNEAEQYYNETFKQI